MRYSICARLSKYSHSIDAFFIFIGYFIVKGVFGLLAIGSFWICTGLVSMAYRGYNSCQIDKLKRIPVQYIVIFNCINWLLNLGSKLIVLDFG